MAFVLASSIGVLGSVLTSSATLTAATLQDAPAPAANQGAKPPDVIHEAFCRNCHQGDPGADKSAWHRYFQFESWLNKDRHSIAGEVLRGTLAVEMQRQLARIDESWKNKSVDSDARCISCHNPPLDPADTRSTTGVECGICHGASGAWNRPHAEDRLDWAKRTDDQKRKLGFKPLHDPRTRGELCASCHIGSASEGRVITHDMYAAGHPPLPSFELSHMSENAYQKHWRPSGDPAKLVTYRGEDKWRSPERDRFRTLSAEPFQAKLVVVGGIESLRASLSVLSTPPAAGRATKSLDYAQFDCYACHHSLTTPSYRQKWAAAEANLTGYGRPPLPYWPQLLARVAFRHAGVPESQLDEILAGVKGAVGAQNFGEVEKVGPAARDALTKLSRLSTQLFKDDLFAPAKAKSLLRELVRIGAEDGVSGKALLDYDTSRQLAWAIQSVLSEPNYKFDKAIVDALDWGPLLKAESKSRLDLSLPSRQAEGRPGEKDTLLVDNLVGALKTRADFQPEAFRERLAKALELLKPE